MIAFSRTPQAGLFVPLSGSAQQQQLMHLVPSLLPDNIPTARPNMDLKAVSVHLAFYSGEQLLPFAYAERAYLKRRCSLPAGIFEQVC